MDLLSMDLLGIERVLRRGTGEVIEEREDALFVFDRVSEAYFLECRGAVQGTEILERHADREIRLLSVFDPELADFAMDRLGLHEKLECFQAAYFGERPAADPKLTYRTAESSDLPMLTEHYHMISPEELAAVIGRGSLLLGYENDRPVGFIGEHLEGSMGLLYVFPEYRRRGYAEEMETYYIARTMDRGLIPFGQVERQNFASLELQKKLGMTISEKTCFWMW